MQDLRWTICACHFCRAIEAVELDFDAMGRISIVFPHPLHEFSIRVEPTETVAKASVLDSLIRFRAVTPHILVHDACPRETALDGNGAIAMLFYQTLEEPIAENEYVLSAVKR